VEINMKAVIVGANGAVGKAVEGCLTGQVFIVD
jgi:hypothetical protein